MSIPSPCVSICAIDEKSGFCKGCRRTVEEVSMWLYYDDAQKAHVIEQLAGRKLSGEQPS